MSKLILKYLSIVATVFFLSMAIDTIRVNSISALLFMGFLLLVVNLLLKPILLLLTLPFSILTLGLFNFIVNAWTIMITDAFVSGVSMGGFFNSLLAALIIVILNHLLKDSSKATVS